MVDIIALILKNDFSKVKILHDSNEIKQEVKKTQEPSKLYDVHIEKAVDLAAFDSNGFSDPYVVIRVNGK